MLPGTLAAGGFLPQRAIDEIDFAAPIQSGASGMPAKRVQEWLSIHGRGVDIDGDFGPATAAAVGEFQGANGLPSTGAVDQPTWEALVAPMVAALQPIPPPALPLDALTAAYATQHVAQHPLEAGGDNCGPWVRMYLGWDGKEAKWCAGFACFGLEQAAHDLGRAFPIQPSAACTTLAERAQQAGCFVVGAPAAPPPGLTPGDFFLVRKAPGAWEHVGVVRSVSPTSFGTLEGNTDHNGSSNGYEAAARIRGYAGKDFIHW